MTGCFAADCVARHEAKMSRIQRSQWIPIYDFYRKIKYNPIDWLH